MMRYEYLKNKVAIVTGASRGIGRAIALEVAKGAALVAILARHEEDLELVAREIEELGTKCLTLVGDVGHMQEMEDLFSKIYQTFGRMDILVNNAGINSRKKLNIIAEEDWDNEIQTNLKGVYVCSKVASEYMKIQRRGWIVNIASIKGREATSSIAYGASKSGVIGLTKSLAKQLIPYNIYVNGVAPGFIDTGMTRLLSPEERKDYLKRIPVGRFGRSEEIASVVCFLVSPAASYVVGTTVDVNGGYMMN